MPVQPEKPVFHLLREAGRPWRSFLMSTGFQMAMVALLFTAFSNRAVQEKVHQAVTLVMPVDLSPAPHPRTQARQGGGGGGDRSLLPASKGRLPKPAPRQFVPPSAVVYNSARKLTMEASILAPPDVNLPTVSLAAYGDPLGKIGAASNGAGSGGGIGSGKGGGVGSGSGGGVGPGDDGGIGGGLYRIVKGATNPVAIFSPEPEYSVEARKARLQGRVQLELIVDESGKPRNIRVLKSLGLGLDEEAIKAASRWRFKPGMKDGKPVPVPALLDIGFFLL